MFNLLVHGNETAWETDQLMRMPLDRFREYSGNDGSFIQLEQPQTLIVLGLIPTLLMYERGARGPNGNVVRVGRVHDVHVAGDDVCFRFLESGRLPRERVEECSDRLGVDRSEHGRTHWAIKDGDLPADLTGGVAPVPGPPVSEHLEFIRLLGEGNFASVWLAKDTKLNREVAVKVFKEAGEGVVAWLDQGRALARVNHPNVNKVYSVDNVRDASGRVVPALVLEFVEGKRMEEILADPPNANVLLDLGVQVIAGLAAIHGEGLHHLDLHEDNMLVSEDGHVSLIDIQYLTSLALLSTVPKQKRDRVDFGYLYGVLIRLAEAAGLGAEAAEPLVRLQARQVYDLDVARECFQEVLSSTGNNEAGSVEAARPPAEPYAPGIEDMISERARRLLASAAKTESDGRVQLTWSRGELIQLRLGKIETSLETERLREQILGAAAELQAQGLLRHDAGREGKVLILKVTASGYDAGERLAGLDPFWI